VGLDLGPDGLISDGVGGRRGVRRMAKRAYEASRLITVANYDPPSSMHVVIRYLWVSSFISLLSPFVLIRLAVTVILYTTSAKATMQRRTLHLARQRILQSLCICTRKRLMKVLILLNARFGRGPFGYCLEVRSSFSHSVLMLISDDSR
jgi:hypothetical protein